MPAIPPERMTDAQKVAAAEISSGPRGGVVGPFIAALRSPECMRRLQHLGAYLRYESHMPPRLRETVILLTARRWRQDYEWFTHVDAARQAGVPEVTIDAIRLGTTPVAASDEESVIFELCETLFADGRVDDALYGRALALLGAAGLVDAICAVGYYSTLALIMNATRTALPDGAVAPRWGSIAGDERGRS